MNKNIVRSLQFSGTVSLVLSPDCMLLQRDVFTRQQDWFVTTANDTADCTPLSNGKAITTLCLSTNHRRFGELQQSLHQELELCSYRTSKLTAEGLTRHQIEICFSRISHMVLKKHVLKIPGRGNEVSKDSLLIGECRRFSFSRQ